MSPTATSFCRSTNCLPRHPGQVRRGQRSCRRRRRAPPARARPRGERRPQLRRVLDRRVARKDTRAGARAPQPWGRTVGHEHGRLFHPAQFSARLRMQVHRGCMAAGAQDQVALQPLAAAPRPNRWRCTVQWRTARAPPTLAIPASDEGPRVHGRGADVGLRPPIHQCNHIHSGGAQRVRHLIGGVAIGRDDHALTAGDAEGMRILFRRARQHHARAIVVRENHRTLERPGGGDDGARANFPQPLAQHAASRRQACRGERQRLARAHQIVVVNAECQGARQLPHAAASGALDEFGNLRIGAPGQGAAERGGRSPTAGCPRPPLPPPPRHSTRQCRRR